MKSLSANEVTLGKSDLCGKSDLSWVTLAELVESI